MTERLLQYIWQMQYYNRNQLVTADGEQLLIIHPGTLNTNQGPDFNDAKIKVNNTLWAGNIELHLLSSDWNAHGHSADQNYQNVILHVVWQDDLPLQVPFPVLELQSKVSKMMLARFDELMNTSRFIACENMIGQVPDLVWTSWKTRLVVERLQRKTAVVIDYLQQNNQHWEETFWWMIARNFGSTVNSDAFEKIARSLPLRLLAKHKHQLHQAEALLFGQAGLLENEFQESYPLLLQKEYRFYKKKYQLKPVSLPLYFLRMRPSNFPTIRLAQLSMLIHHSSHLFSLIKEASGLPEVIKLLDVKANDYWHYHYRLGEPSAYREKNLGEQTIHSIIINTVVPILFAFGHYHQDEALKEKALNWLQHAKAEKNNITRGFQLVGIKNDTAFDSQALLQLKNLYCMHRRCLECAVGNKLLRPQKEPIP